MTYLTDLLSNPIAVSAALGWFSAQFIKTVLYFIINHEFNAERIFGSGGMPSSHSSTVCALAASTAFIYGTGGFEFPMAFFFAFIVMYDATGVRKETGEQARVINELVEEWREMGRNIESLEPMEQLKELVGHTPLQVAAGALLGVLIAYIVCTVMA